MALTFMKFAILANGWTKSGDVILILDRIRLGTTFATNYVELGALLGD